MWFPGQVRHLIASITELCFLLYLVLSTAYLYAIMMVTGDYTLECHRNIEDWLVYVLFAKSRIYSNTNNYFLFDLILYVPSIMFQLCRDGSSWVYIRTKLGLLFLAQEHNKVTPVRLKPTAPRSRVRHYTTEPLRF